MPGGKQIAATSGSEIDESLIQKHAQFVNERETLFASIQKVFDKSENLTEKNVPSFVASYDRLAIIEAKLEDLSVRLREFNPLVPDKWKLGITDYYCSAIELIDLARSNYVNAKKSQTIPIIPSPGNIIPTTAAHLPTISLPTFSGKIEEWTEYYSLFTSLVHHETSLEGMDVKKFQYLRSSLRGDALAVISSFPLNAESYPLALEALVTRYQNRRRLASHFMNKIFDFKSLREPKHADFQRFLNIHENSWNAFNKLDQIDHFDFVKLHIALNHLDPSTRRSFEMKYSSYTIPTHKNLIDFVTELSRREELLVTDVQTRGKETTNNFSSSSTSKSNFRKSEQVSLYQVSHKDTKLPSSQLDKDVPQKLSSVATQKPSGPTPSTSSTEATSSELGCWNCKSSGHLYPTCPLPRKLFCYRCGYAGVKVSSCPNCCPGNLNGRRS